jgi:hypothetical protein
MRGEDRRLEEGRCWWKTQRAALRRGIDVDELDVTASQFSGEEQIEERRLERTGRERKLPATQVSGRVDSFRRSDRCHFEV